MTGHTVLVNYETPPLAEHTIIAPKPVVIDAPDSLKMTVLFDNTAHNIACKASWGFACLIQGADNTILFDTGADGAILLANMHTLNIDPEIVDTIILSHEHWDHIDGLPVFLAAHNDVTVVMPQSFSDTLKKLVTDTGAKLIEVHEPVRICDHVALTGEIGTSIIEQSLVIDTKKGLVIITGCAHPGIELILRTLRQRYHRPFLFVLGGFHLYKSTMSEIDSVIAAFIELGIVRVGATHCTGEEAIKRFREIYGDHFIPVGAGKIITLSHL